MMNFGLKYNFGEELPEPKNFHTENLQWPDFSGGYSVRQSLKFRRN